MEELLQTPLIEVIKVLLELIGFGGLVILGIKKFGELITIVSWIILAILFGIVYPIGQISQYIDLLFVFIGVITLMVVIPRYEIRKKEDYTNKEES